MWQPADQTIHRIHEAAHGLIRDAYRADLVSLWHLSSSDKQPMEGHSPADVYLSTRHRLGHAACGKGSNHGDELRLNPGGCWKGRVGGIMESIISTALQGTCRFETHKMALVQRAVTGFM